MTMLPHIWGNKMFTAYCWFFNAVASENPSTPNHAKRIALGRMMIDHEFTYARFVEADMVGQGYDSDTPQETINDRLSALATNMVNAGCGG